MKKTVLAFLVSLTVLFVSQAQQVVEDNFRQLQVVFSVGDLEMNKSELDGQTFIQLRLDGMMPSSVVGAPELPTWSSLIEVPLCSGFEVEVSNAVWDTVSIPDYTVMPLQPSRSKSDYGPFPLVQDMRVYGANEFFSAAELAMVETVGIARDRNMARLQFSPVHYNPVSRQAAVCRKATVTVRYNNADSNSTIAMFEQYYSPAFGVRGMTLNSLYPKSVNSSAPLRYLIVAHSMFHGELDDFVNWKRRKGFITDIVYTDDAGVGTTSTDIAAYIKSQYTNATATNPAPTYLLIVGDHEQIPAFTGTTDNDHITDLYFTTWSAGDNIPDCYYGRFSAQTVDQLTPQIDKTLMYEQYTFADPSFLDRAVMVAGVDAGNSGDNGYTYGDPAMDYAITNYVNGAHGFSQVKYFKNNTTIVPTGSNVTVGSSASSNSATVRGFYNQGAGWINYTAHGSATSWGTPSFTTNDAAAMTNTQKFGIMVGNCCLTNKFQTSTCLGESVLRKGNYCGAVGYLGGSNSTYWGEDFYWAVGLRSSIGPNMSMAYNSSNLGGYDRIFHTHSEAYSQWVTTQGELLFQGNMAVQSSSSSRKLYYWEIYHLMGDPSLMPYLTQAQQMTLSATSVIMLGTSTLSVTAAPYSYVAITDTATHTLWASGFANASGVVSLSLPTGMTVGGYELVASAQQYRTAFQPINVVPASGPYAATVSISPSAALNAGSTVPLTIKVANLGNSAASGVTMSLSSDNPLLTLSTSSVTIGNIPVGDTVTVTTVSVTASSQATDGTHAIITSNTHWSGSSTQVTNSTTLTINAPAVAMQITPASTSMLPDSNMSVVVNIANNGHASLGNSWLTITTGNPLLTVSYSGSNFSLAQGSNVNRQFQLHAAHNIDTNIIVPVYVHMSGAATMDDTLQLYIGINTTETFEGGHFQVQGWIQGSYPWTFTNAESYEGSWSARSTIELGDNNSSELMISLNVATADSISFYYKVSSEQNYDKFKCMLDGNEMLVASGDVSWTRHAFAVAAGSHTLTFAYTKDYSVSNGSDCAWIDNISLPHGSLSESQGQGGDEEQGTFQNLTVDFESASNDNNWTLLGENMGNVWKIGSAASNGTGRGLYITNDGGQSNAYTINSSATVFAYTTCWLDTGTYVMAFDWRCNGESNYDFLRAALVPNNMTLSASSELPSGWTTTTVPTGVIAIDGGQKLNQSSSWTTQSSEVRVNLSGWYKLAFMWRNDQSVGNMPPAAVDNVMVLKASEVHTITVTANHGTTIGSGNYQTGEIATVGVFPEAGYTFAGWNDGGTENPRQLMVDSDRSFVAMLTQGNVVTMHDTAWVHDTTLVNVLVHDTTVVTQLDTITLTETEYVTVHDTTVVTITDTLTLTEYVPVHDTTVLTFTDTLTLTEYVPVHDTTVLTFTDTLTLTEYIQVHDTTVLTFTDTLTLTEYIQVHDTTVLTFTDTLTLTEYIPVHDTTYIDGAFYDTIYFNQGVHDTTIVTVTEFVPVHDTTIVTLTDTVTLTEFVPVHDTTIVTLTDTVTLTEFVPVHDTTIVTLTDTVTLTEFVPVHDTTVVTLTDTVTLTEFVPVHDTTIVTLTDTVTLTEFVPVHDTTVVTLTDTVTLTEFVPVHDTTIVTLTDTVTLTEFVPVHDTTVVTLTDTVTLTEYIPVHDTTFITVTDTVINTVFDTVTNTVYDSINIYVFDTTIVTDTLWMTETDTLWITDTIYFFDTIFIHDTIYVSQEGVEDVSAMNIKVYSDRGEIVVEGAEGAMVTLYDLTGRTLAKRRDEYSPLRFEAPVSGTYIIKAGNHPARKVVVIR